MDWARPGFGHANASLASDSLNLSLAVCNSGDRASAEVTQFYLSDFHASTIAPLHHLVGFERIHLQAGENRTLKFTLTPEMMSFFKGAGKLTLEPGKFRLEVGGCSPGKRGQVLGAPKPVTAMFEVLS